MFMVSLYIQTFSQNICLSVLPRKNSLKIAFVSFFCMTSLKAEMKSWGRMFGLYSLSLLTLLPPSCALFCKEIHNVRGEIQE